MRGRKKYSDIASKMGFLTLYLLLMLVIVVISFCKGVYAWDGTYIPALAGFIEPDSLSFPLSLVLGLLFFALTIASVYYLGGAVFASFFKSGYISLIYAILALINPSAIIFSGASIALLLVIWSLYFIIRSRKINSAVFVSPFLASAAALFYPYLLFFVVVSMFFTLTSKEFTFRQLVTSVMGAVFPVVFLFSLRYVFFEDISLFWELLKLEILDISLPKLSAKSVPEVLQMLLLIVLALSSIRSIVRSIRYYRVEESYALSRMIVIIIFFAIANAVYQGTYGFYMPFIALPMAFFICEYINADAIEHNTNSIRGKTLLVLLIIMIVAKIDIFV